MADDPYRHAHGHNQQPGNEWNDSRGMRAPNPGSVGSGWSTPAPGGGTGGGSGIGALILILMAAVVVLPAAAMALLATPILKLSAARLGGRYSSFGWYLTVRTTFVGAMAYLALTVLMFFVAEGYLSYGLDGIPSTLTGLTHWQQWLTATGWAAGQVIEVVARVWMLGAEYEEYTRLYPSALPLSLKIAGTLTLHLPGLLAYAWVVWRAGFVDEGLRGLSLGVGVAAALVILTAPLLIWLGAFFITA